MAHGRHYPKYCQAIREIEPPSLFENRVSYRLLNLPGYRSRQEQTYGHATYFAMVDVCEALAHEIAAADGACLAMVMTGERHFRH